MLADVIRRYQEYNPDTDQFDRARNTTEYAELLGMNAVHLFQIYNGSRNPGMATFSKLMRAFPNTTEAIGKEMAAAMRAELGEAVPA